MKHHPQLFLEKCSYKLFQNNFILISTKMSYKGTFSFPKIYVENQKFNFPPKKTHILSDVDCILL